MTEEQFYKLVPGNKVRYLLPNHVVYTIRRIDESDDHALYVDGGKIPKSDAIKLYEVVTDEPDVEFIHCVQDWYDKDGNLEVQHVDVMATNGYAHCKLSLYANEDAAILSAVYVIQDARNKGICNAMLNYVDKQLQVRKHMIVYVDSYAPDYIRKMYRKRGYIIMNSGE